MWYDGRVFTYNWCIYKYNNRGWIACKSKNKGHRNHKQEQDTMYGNGMGVQMQTNFRQGAK